MSENRKEIRCSRLRLANRHGGIILGALIAILLIASLPASADPTVEELEEQLKVLDDGAQPRAAAPKTTADEPSTITLICKGKQDWRFAYIRNNETATFLSTDTHAGISDTETVIIDLRSKTAAALFWDSIPVNITEDHVAYDKSRRTSKAKVYRFFLDRFTKKFRIAYKENVTDFKSIVLHRYYDGKCEAAQEKKF